MSTCTYVHRKFDPASEYSVKWMALRSKHKHEWHYTPWENNSTEKLNDYLSKKKNNGQIHKLEENVMTK